jgi:hypothetical protein
MNVRQLQHWRLRMNNQGAQMQKLSQRHLLIITEPAKARFAHCITVSSATGNDGSSLPGPNRYAPRYRPRTDRFGCTRTDS